MSFMLLGILNSQALAGGGGAAMELIETKILTSSLGSTALSFTNIPSTYKHLQIRVTNMNTNSGSIALQFNGVTSTVYNNHYLRASNYSGSVESGWNGSQADRIYIDAGFEAYGSTVLDVLDYASASKNSVIRAQTGFYNSGSNYAVRLVSGLYEQTAAVSSIQFRTSFGTAQIGTRISIYGIKG